MTPPKLLVVSGKVRTKFQDNLLRNLRQAFELRSSSHVNFYKVEDISRSTVEDFDLKGDSDDLDEVAKDLRGQSRNVIPVQKIGDWTVLLGLRLSWRKSSAGYQYVSSQIILFLRSAMGEEPKQFLRLEWEGFRLDGTFEASSAAHPHWQIDIIPKPSTASDADPFPISDLAFPIQSTVSRQPHWLPKIHFAAAADWAVTTWNGEPDSPAHAAGPATIEELLNWTSSACWYLNGQLAGALAGS